MNHCLCYSTRFALAGGFSSPVYDSVPETAIGLNRFTRSINPLLSLLETSHEIYMRLPHFYAARVARLVFLNIHRHTSTIQGVPFNIILLCHIPSRSNDPSLTVRSLLLYPPRHILSFTSLRFVACSNQTSEHERLQDDDPCLSARPATTDPLLPRRPYCNMFGQAAIPIRFV